ncbi:MAG: winged helix-turn-helix transcriptional regulator [Candidatus Diapherotrites archaeon]|nr:winged helix-turn-helix transcriptional regulator [Candidatus Diapherotrites archaeon]
MTIKTITIVQRERPYSDDLNENIAWLLESLGISRAMLQKYSRILTEIAKSGGKISATEIAEIIGDPRTSITYHIGKLAEMGIILREGRGYRLRAGTFLRSIEEMERDVIRMFEDMKKVAQILDEQLGLPRR